MGHGSRRDGRRPLGLSVAPSLSALAVDDAETRPSLLSACQPMGLLPLPLSLLLAAAPVVTPLGSAPAPASLPMARETFDALLLEGDLSELQEACVESAGFGANDRLQQLRDRLLQVAPAPQPFSVVMANARALMTCKDPAGAQRVLSRYGPGTCLLYTSDAADDC